MSETVLTFDDGVTAVIDVTTTSNVITTGASATTIITQEQIPGDVTSATVMAVIEAVVTSPAVVTAPQPSTYVITEGGPVGPQGSPGAIGPEGQPRFQGVGPPPDVIPGAVVGDGYLDVSTGDYYQLA